MLEGPGYTLNELKAVQDWVLQRALKTVPGVIDVTGFGGTVKQYLVLVDPMQLNHYGITLQQVQDAIQKSNANVGGNILTLGSQSHIVRGIGLLGKGIDALDPANVSATEPSSSIRSSTISATSSSLSIEGIPILVSHVAKVVEGHQPRLGIVGRHSGSRQENDVIEGIVLMRKYEKSLPTSELVKKKIEEIARAKAPAAGNEDQDLQRAHRARPRDDRITCCTTCLVGMGLVIAILFIFLGDLASAGIVAIMIPLALLFSITRALRSGQIGQSALDRRGRLRNHRRQLDDHRREHLPAHHRARTPTGRARSSTGSSKRRARSSAPSSSRRRSSSARSSRSSRCRGPKGRSSARWPTPTRSPSAAPC